MDAEKRVNKKWCGLYKNVLFTKNMLILLTQLLLRFDDSKYTIEKVN